jgi:D-galactarolactone isomerase
MIQRKLSGAPPRTPVPPGTIDTQTHMYLPQFPQAPGGSPVPAGVPGPQDYRRVMDWLGIERVVVT